MSLQDDADVIHTHSRAQAIEDGTLVDVSTVAREAGITFPVAVTATLWAAIEAIPEFYAWQDVKGRLWDVLFLLAAAIRKVDGRFSELFYTLNLPHGKERNIRLKAVCGLGDAGEPVITVMFPDDD